LFVSGLGFVYFSLVNNNSNQTPTTVHYVQRNTNHALPSILTDDDYSDNPILLLRQPIYDENSRNKKTKLHCVKDKGPNAYFYSTCNLILKTTNKFHHRQRISAALLQGPFKN